jgi:hypothetical protein
VADGVDGIQGNDLRLKRSLAIQRSFATLVA